MAVKISELPNLQVGDLTTTSSLLPIVSDISGENVTYNTSMANVKTYMETGDFDITGNLTATGEVIITGNLTCDVLTANTQVIGETTTVSSTSNFIDIQTDGNLALPISDNGLDVGTRLFYYKTAGDVAALVWKNSTRRLTWYGNGVGNAVTSIDAGASLGTMEAGQFIASNSTAATSATSGALIVTGGAGIGGNAYIGSNLVITGNTSGSNLSLTGRAIITGNISTSGNIATSLRTTTGTFNVNTFATIGTTLVAGGNATVQGLTVNASATFGTTLGVTGNANVGGATINGTATIASTLGVTGVIRGGSIQNTPIGSTTESTGKFSTLTTTGISTLGADVTVVGNVNPSATNTYTLGNLSNKWDYLYANVSAANATTALYADLAEKYVPDQYYDPGTVVVFGGEKEITVTDQQGDTRVAGAISTQPAYLMNEGQEDGIALALRGKVPVKVVGSVNKGDLLITSNNAGYATAAKFYAPDPNAVFAKSLERDDSENPRVIWAVIL